MTLLLEKLDEIKNINSNELTDAEIKRIFKFIKQLGISKDSYFQKPFCQKHELDKIELKKEIVNMDFINEELVKRILKELNNPNKAYDSDTLLEFMIKDILIKINETICFTVNYYIFGQTHEEYRETFEKMHINKSTKKQEDIKFIKEILKKLDKKYEIDEAKLQMNKEGFQNEL